MNHAALNVALYGETRRWALTERGASKVWRDGSNLAIGPSALHWDGATLSFQIEEVTAPLPSRLRGTVRLHTGGLNGRVFTLDAAGRHRWSPISAASRVEVAFDQPGLSWSGPAYFDTNEGDAPLESDFVDWDWCRAKLRDGTAILYNARRRDGTSQALALRTLPGGGVEEIAPQAEAELPRTRIWRIPRPTRAEPGASPRLVRTLEDTPFYARSVIGTRILGEDAVAVHESLSLDRFRLPVVQAMLGFKVPRALR
ncbi:MAG TPA: carotenoid 1,2-hydratase [Acetobacteraceae bacterium]|nr:carotenoid 1,2-hydratase [Acetobacteraceae bacterium]